MDIKRTNYSSGAPLEETVGYSRVVKTGPFIFVGGTTSVQPDGSVYGEGDSYAQVKYVLEKLVKLVENAGGKVEDIYSVKMYSTPDFNGKEGLKAYSEFFKEIKPLCTSVCIAKLNRPTQLVEIELNAVIGCSEGAEWEGISLKRENFSSGAPLEATVGYSRMVKIGPFVYIGGTTSVQPDGSVYGEESSKQQMNYVLEKEVKLLEKAGAKPSDVVKIKSYATLDFKKYNKAEETDFYSDTFKSVKPLNTLVTIAKLNRPTQLVEIEMMAVVGCGGDEVLKEWGNLDLRRSNYSSGAPLEDVVGYSRIVKVGPFVYCGGTTSVQPDGSVYGEEDAKAQESYVFKKLMKLMEDIGVKADDVVKCKNYETPLYKEFMKKESENYYAEVLKPVKPLYTGVTIAELNRPTQLTEIEMMAVIGCGK